MKLGLPSPLPRPFNDPGRSAEVLPGMLRAWVPVRVIVDPDYGPFLVVGHPFECRPIAEPHCEPESVSLLADLWWRIRYSAFLVAFVGRPDWGKPEDQRTVHQPCRWCGFYADAPPAPPTFTTGAEVVLVGRVRRRGETCWGRQQTVHRIWLAGWCNQPDHGVFGSDRPAKSLQEKFASNNHPEHCASRFRRQPAEFLASFEDSSEGAASAEAVSLCRLCAEVWSSGKVFGTEELGALVGAPVVWRR